MLLAVSACGNSDEDSSVSERCKQAKADSKSAEKEASDVIPSGSAAGSFDLQALLNRVRQGAATPTDLLIYNAAVQVTQITVDNPKCFRPGEVAQAKGTLKTLNSYWPQ
jgi:hypothetical protein